MGMRSVSALPFSDRVRAAVRVKTTAVGAHDLQAILNAYDLVPDLRGSGGSFRALRAYYALVEKLGRFMPSLAKWSEAELTSCSRYAAFLVDRHLERNRCSAAKMRGT
jgi:hypothetical protein